MAEVPSTWLTPDPVVERVKLDATSWLDVVRGLVVHADRVHDELVASVAWSQGRNFRYERWVDEPRLGGWQKPGHEHPALAEARAWVAGRYGVTFDGSALARYRNGRDGQSFHRDREMTWLEDTIIGVLTLGARRPWLVRPADQRRAHDELEMDDTVDARPDSGDLLVMGGRCQLDWLHSVPKLDRPVGDRISVQWRWTSRAGRPDIEPKFRAPRRYSNR
jgi:alkylated DNA repair dioxygenase AlkB